MNGDSWEFPRGRVLAHRGLAQHTKQNSLAALERALECGFGIETDLRDLVGRPVVSHDSPPPDALALDKLVDVLQGYQSCAQYLAFNIKADGLSDALARLGPSLPSAHFFFDMSFPEFLRYYNLELPIAVRVSEFEIPGSLEFGPQSRAQYLWIDCFTRDWFVGDPGLLALLRHKKAFLVSPDIHGRDPMVAWQWVLEMHANGFHIGICTDKPVEFIAWSESDRRRSTP